MRLTLTMDKARPVTLTDADYITAGGQASIYGRGNLIYKIYENRGNVKADKYDELRRLLPKANIIKPQKILYDARGMAVGYAMPWVKGSVSLCKVFANAYRDRANITAHVVNALVENIRGDIDYIHRNGCLVVDCNEYNILVGTADHSKPFFIDTDSYQTPNHPADAVMPAIADPHAHGFTAATDWFAFAILACQLFTGIHPYKGTHPAYRKGDMAARMRDNVSIFNKAVALPSAARPIALIPQNYREWLTRTLEQGKREEPPARIGQQPPRRPATKVAPQPTGLIATIASTTYGSTVLAAVPTPMGLLVRTRYAIHTPDRAYQLPYSANESLAATKDGQILVAAGNTLYLLQDDGTLATLPISAQSLIQAGPHICAMQRDAMTQVNVATINGRNMASCGTAWPIHPNNRQAFDTMAIQWLLDMPYLILPHDSNGRLSMAIIRLEGLAGQKVVDARHERNVCVVVGRKGSTYSRHTIRISPDFATTETTTEQDIDTPSANFAVLPNGTAIRIPEDGLIELFPSRIGDTRKRQVRDANVRTTMRLLSNGNKVLACEGNTIAQITMEEKGGPA